MHGTIGRSSYIRIGIVLAVALSATWPSGLACARPAAPTNNAPTGDIRAVVIDPTTPTTLYAGGADGIFRSTDAGTTWVAASAGLTTLSVDSLVINPITPATLYAGEYGSGVFKSTDSGGTWAAANLGLTQPSVAALAINPQNPATLYAGTNFGGIYKSTNSGGSWAAANSGLTNLFVTALLIRSSTPSTLHAGTGSLVFLSTDSGGTWQAAGLTYWTNALASKETSPTALYAGTNASGIFKCTIFGIWASASTGLTSLNIRALANDPTTPTTLYAGTGGGVFKSTNSGGIWAAANSGLTNLTVNALAIDPSTPATLYAGTGGGVFKSTNSGVTWVAASCTPPSTVQNVAATPNGANHVDITWDPAAGAATYTVQRGDGTCPAGAYATIATGVTGTSYPDTAVSGGSAYAYRVVAVGADTCQANPSTCVGATATGLCTLTPTFAGLTSVTNSLQATCQLAVSWGTGTARCGTNVVYNLYRSTTPGFTPAPANRIVNCLAGTAYTDLAVVSGARYYYVARAEDDSGNGTGPCRAGNEDTNTTRKDGIPTGAPVVVLQDDMEAGSAKWTTMGSGTPWAIVTTLSSSPTHSFFADDPGAVSDRSLRTASPIAVGTGSTLQFWHRYNTEMGASAYDGGVLEWSLDGTTWRDILAGGGAIPANAARFTQGGYVATISSSYSSPISGRQAWSGDNTAFEKVIVDLTDFAGQSVIFRWRMASDSVNSDIGWWVDDVTVTQGITCVTYSPPPLGFHTLAPCRIVDTRDPDGALGGPALAAGLERTFTLAGSCGVPLTAVAVSANITVTQGTDPGTLQILPAGATPTATSNVSFAAGRTRANNSLLLLSGTGAVSVLDGQASGTVHLIVDVNGYFQ